MTMRKLIAAVAGLAIAWAGAAHAQDSGAREFSITTGVDYSTGDYGTGVDTDILVVPVTARLSTGNARFSASIPYLRIDGASNIVGGEGGPIVVDPNTPATERSGIGDLTLGANYAIPEDRMGVGLDLGARVKLPTAKDGLGTGETDYSVSGELSKTFGTVTPFLQGGYRVMGDPDGIDLNNILFGSAGASVSVGRSVVLASYDYRQATSDLVEDSQEVFGAFSTPVSERLNFTIYGSAGLSEGAADIGAGAMITVKAF
jgi:hypothetical protein